MSKEYKSGVVLLSGGLDSAVCLGIADKECEKVHPLVLEYGQKTLARESTCAAALATHYQTEAMRMVRLDFIAELTGAALCSRNQEVTGANEYVPFRNGLFLSVATALAESVGAGVIYIGSVGTDRICRDNSPAFRRAFESVVAEGTNTDSRIIISAPLGELTKVQVVQRGFELGVPLEHTWSCHNNIDTPCDSCSNCISRRDAFATVGKVDPIRINPKL